MLDIFLKDLRYSARLLLRSPGFTLTAIAALALGIAVNSAMFSVVNAVLLKPFAYPDPDRIVMFQSTFPAGRTGSASPTLFNWWRQQTASFEDISAYEFNVANWTGTSSPEQIPIMHVSAGFLALSRANPVYGRTFTPADDLPHGPKTVVLTWSFWQRSFGADPGVIGRRMTLNGEPHEIIGVLGPAAPNTLLAEQSLISGDIEINDPPDLYIPFQLDPASALQGRYFNVAARLKPGITLAAANGQLQASYSGYARKWPNDFTPGASFAVEPLQNAITGGVRNSLLILLGAVALVLLIACANVANLLLARAADRKREMAIRAAVGAGRSRILRQLLTESLILSLTGGMLGSMAGYFGIRAILTLVPPNIPRLGPAGANVELDWRVFAFTATLSILTGIAFGLAPAWQSSRTDLTHALKNSGHRATGLDQNRTRAVLVAAEMALAVVLLIGAALLIRTFVAIRQVHPGFEARNVVTLNTSLVGPQFARPAAVVQVIRQGLRRVRDLPGVQAAAVTCCVPLETRLSTGIRSLARPQGPTLQGAVGWTPVSAGYFNALRIPVLRGREFTDGDDTGPRVAIINQSLAKQFWPASDPLHDRIVIGNQTPREIVAVVGDVRDSALHLQPRPMLYTPIAQMSDPETTMLSQTLSWVWVIRTRAAPLVLSSALQDTVRQASGGLPVARVRTMNDTLSRSTAAGDFETLVLAIFGGSALLLAAIGVYGLMAYSVTRRTQEIGIRLALGAASIHIRNMVVAQGLRPALTGIGCGLAAAFGLTRLLAGLLFGVDPRDTLAFTIVPAILLAVALLAVWLPAIRASRVDPSLALRQD